MLQASRVPPVEWVACGVCSRFAAKNIDKWLFNTTRARRILEDVRVGVK